jgi:hypothetical protein
MTVLDLHPRQWPPMWRTAGWWFVLAIGAAALVDALLWDISASFFAWIAAPLAALVFAAPLLIGAIWIVVRCIANLIREREQLAKGLVTSAPPIAAIAIAIVLFNPIASGVGALLTWATFAHDRPRYEKIEAQILASPSRQTTPANPLRKTPDGQVFEAEHSPPYRIAFYLPDHWLSDRQAIIYTPQPGPTAAAFDDWLVSYDCRPLSGRYTTCWLSPR